MWGTLPLCSISIILSCRPFIYFSLETYTELVSLGMKSCSTIFYVFYIFNRYKVPLDDRFNLNQTKCKSHSHVKGFKSVILI